MITAAALRADVLDQFRRYWPAGDGAVRRLPLVERERDGAEPLPPRLRRVALPGWAADLDPDGGIPIPADLAGDGDWSQVDWLHAAGWYLHGLAERAHESACGPIHSFSFRLRGWDPALWSRAWANRIALFLRRWASRLAGQAEETVCGPLPDTEIVLTHDLDAVAITLAIRAKQGAFHCFNALRALLSGRLAAVPTALASAMRLACGRGDPGGLALLASQVETAGRRGRIHVYGGSGGWWRWPMDLLLDPSYQVRPGSALGAQLTELHGRGWTIGLHPSFRAWRDPARMAAERSRVEAATGIALTHVRNHWLRFSWQHTWMAQVTAGLTEDSTLGFNDRPGFRCGAALCYRPRDGSTLPLLLKALPLVLMDSHLYDYRPTAAPAAAINRWLDEVDAVRGEAAVLWHPHTIGRTYGWRNGLSCLLATLCRLESARRRDGPGASL